MKIENEKIGVLDVGSNSVRALLTDGTFLYRNLITTRLGEGQGEEKTLKDEPIKRTVQAIGKLTSELVYQGADKIYAFATEAVRSAKNKNKFLDLVEEKINIKIDVVSGEEEGELGLLGAFSGKDGTILDIGGASSEITVAKGGKIIYSKSMPLGAVRLYDLCKEDLQKLNAEIDGKINVFSNLPKIDDLRLIGGTATTVGAINLKLEKYDATKVNGCKLNSFELDDILTEVKTRTVKERIDELHIHEKRAEIIVGGICLLKRLIGLMDIKTATVMESDNLYGYYLKRIKGISYEK